MPRTPVSHFILPGVVVMRAARKCEGSRIAFVAHVLHPGFGLKERIDGNRFQPHEETIEVVLRGDLIFRKFAGCVLPIGL